jgi:hypothetical protein
VRGITYDDHFNQRVTTIATDPLADALTCTHDVKYLAQLGINTIITDTFNTVADHSSCMRTFEDAGVYIIALLTHEIDAGYRINGSVYRAVDYTRFDGYYKLIDELSVYPNLLGIMVDMKDYKVDRLEMVPRYKATIRDMKEHIRRTTKRPIPVGAYGFHHGKSMLIPEFMSCGGLDVTADFYELNPARKTHIYDGTFWCAKSSTEYDKLVGQYRNYPLPVLLSYGCDANVSHEFPEVQYIYSGEGAEVFSGGVVHDWLQNKYGAGPDAGNSQSCTSFSVVSQIHIGLVEEAGTDFKPRKGYWALSSQLALIQPTGTQIQEYKPSSTASPCRNITLRSGIDTNAHFDGEIKLSTQIPSPPNSYLCSCMTQTLNCIANTNSTTAEMSVWLSSTCELDYPLCAGIAFNASEGRYGSYLMCNLTERASWTQQQIFASKGNDEKACSDAGGIIQHPAPSASLPKDCQFLLHQAKPDGRGTVTSIPTSVPSQSSSLLPASTSSLNTAAKVGIIASVAVLGVLCVLLGVCLWSRRQNRRGSLKSSVGEFQKAELPDTFVKPKAKDGVVLDSREVQELAGSDKPVEMEGDGRYVEVHGEHLVELPTVSDQREELEEPRL